MSTQTLNQYIEV
jgi:heme o synthase